MKISTDKKIPKWEILNKLMEEMGWTLVKTKMNWFQYQKGKEIIIAREFDSTKKWKAELFLNKRLIQSTGFNDEQFARILTLELAMHALL